MRPGLVRDLLLHQRRPHVRRVDAVGGDASGPTLQGDGLGEPLEAVLGRDVGGFVRRGPQTVHGGDVDYAPPPLLVHPRERLLDDPERRLEHDPHDEHEALGRELLEWCDMLQPRVVHDDVSVDLEVLEDVVVREVGLHGLAPYLARHLFRGVPVQVEDGHGGAGPGQPPGASSSYPAGRPGHQGAAPAEVYPGRGRPRQDGSLAHNYLPSRRSPDRKTYAQSLPDVGGTKAFSRGGKNRGGASVRAAPLAYYCALGSGPSE